MELDFDFSFGESRLARYLVLFVVVLIPALLLRGKSERKGQAGAPFAPPVPYRLPLGTPSHPFTTLCSLLGAAEANRQPCNK